MSTTFAGDSKLNKSKIQNILHRLESQVKINKMEGNLDKHKHKILFKKLIMQVLGIGNLPGHFS